MANPGGLEQKFRQAVAAHGAGRLDEAMAGYRGVLRKDPKHAFARHYLGVACHQAGQLAEALPLLESSTARLAGNAGCVLNLANLYKDLGRLADAEQRYLAAGRLDPGLALVGFNLGQLRELRGDLDGAEAAYRSAGSLPQARRRQAVLCIDRDPADAMALAPAEEERGLLGEALGVLAHAGEGARCEVVIARLVALGAADTLADGGATLARSGHLEIARQALAGALALAPHALPVRASLATVLNDLGAFGEALALATAVPDGGSDARLLVARADAAKELGDLDLATAALEQARVLAPQRLDIHGSLQQLRLCRGAWTPADMLASAREYGEAVRRHARARPASLPSVEAPTARRSGRLRLGLLSSELAWTPIGRFMAGFIDHYPRERIELWLFSDRPGAPDELALRFHRRAHRVVACAGWDDERLAQALVEARLDVLLELTGHAGANRLPMLSWRLAPCQGSFLGYAGTTGAPALDVRIADAITEPAGAERFSSEAVLRLPGSYFCFDPACALPAPGPAPALANGFVTFGCFVQRPKISDATLRTWIAVLAAVHGARMQLRCRSFGDAAARDATIRAITALGGDPSRFELLPWGQREDFLAHYRAIDIGLDTFPFHQATNLCDALWMGVPTLSLSGALHCSRMADSIYTAAGLDGWCHGSEGALVEAALRQANDAAGLDALRRGLRGQAEASALADGRAFAARMAALLTTL